MKLVGESEDPSLMLDGLETLQGYSLEQGLSSGVVYTARSAF